MRTTLRNFFRKSFFISFLSLFVTTTTNAIEALPVKIIATEIIPNFNSITNSETGTTLKHSFTGSNPISTADNERILTGSELDIEELEEYEALKLEYTIGHVDCHGGNNGYATANVRGGMAPYTYQWSNGATTQTITNLVAGTYTLVVKDVNGKRRSCRLKIKEPAKLAHKILKLSDASAAGASDGSARVTVSGGAKPYSYAWDNGETTATATELNAGRHRVTITDNNGCTKQCYIQINEPNPPVEEVCDGVDNNGDGQVDEGFADTDGDGISDCVDPCDDTIDTDGDGISDCMDPCDDSIDTDRDGISDCVDPCDDTIDTDGDGISDCVDTCDDTIDTDGDGISDCIDTCDDTIDTDGDGISDCEDTCDDTIDTDGDGISDCVDPCDDTIDTDGDGISDCIDTCDDTIDTDGDGISDCEDPCDDSIDTDRDGISDCVDPCDDTIDTDGDGISDCVDTCDDTIDTDGDGISDCIDTCDDTIDTDGDGISDCEDTCDDTIDTDGDGISDCVDPCDDTIDTDGDGISDCIDTCDDTIDTDGDGISDCIDTCDDTIDTDGDGISDCEDPCDDTIDTDGDGISDCEDPCDDAIDTDRDGISDCEDPCDDSIDTDGDGISDCVDTCDDTIDTDGDGISDCEDTCDDTIDTDGDGISDCEDTCDDTIDTDGDGISDCEDPCDDTIDTDRDGISDCEDTCDDTIDTDRDGISDCEDPCDDSIDTDGDGISDCVDTCDDTIDTDGDGISDCEDPCDDAIDTDRDGISDCVDPCDDTIDTDGDGISDCEDVEECDGVDNDGDGEVDEGFDVNNNGTADCFDTDPCDFSTQLGTDIDGEAANDQLGRSVSMSADGSRVAIGAIGNDGNGSNSGHVRVYSWNGSTWGQLGIDINGEATNDQSGYSVSLSADGNRLAIGAYGNDGNGSNSGHVRVYSWNGSTWVQLGTDIDGEAANDRLGWSVSLSADGSRVAIGAIGNDGNGNDSGHVRVYSWSGSTWMQLGTDIDGEAANDVSGYSVSMSANGSRVAIGALYNNGNGIASGHVRVYSWNGSTWVQLGTDIDGEAAFDQSGYSVSMSANGSRVAIGANANDGNGNASGHVRVYSWNGSTWGQLGTDIDGEAAFDLSGYSVSMDADGSRVAIGALYNKGSGRNSGHVRVYSWNGSTWVQQGTDVNGEASNDQSGYSVSMSADGSRVAIGANANDGNGKNSGHVRIYGCGQATEENEQSFVQRQTSGTIVTVFQEPQSEVLSLDMDIPYDATIKVNFLDTSGRTVLTPKSRMVNAGTNRLEYNMGVVPSQVLIMNIYTGRELIAKKILLNK